MTAYIGTRSARKWTGLVGSGGVADASVTTVPVSSTTGLTNGKVYLFYVDRVDSNGTKTPSNEELIKGTLSGSNFINCTRGVAGTAQAHNAGAVIEVLWTSTHWEELIDALEVEHNSDGTHNFAGTVEVSGSSSSAAEIKLYEDTDNGTNYMGLKAPSAVTTSTDLVLPNGDGSADQVLKTDGSGNLGWVDQSQGILSTTQYAPEGFLINGKIVPSVASNNLTVAIKGMDGNDPSASNPVYCRIGDTVHTITSALSVTKNAGTNWCNAGSSELATKEIDYFVYLGYNATDGVVVGFSRIPYATIYSDFSATTTDAKYCAISTITNAASGDNYVNIGRFAATLSAGAGYTWSVPTFTGANLIQRPILQSKILSWTPTYSASGSLTFTSVTTGRAVYQLNDRYLDFELQCQGTLGGSASNALYTTIPLYRSYNNIATNGYGNVGSGSGVLGYAQWAFNTSQTNMQWFQYNLANYATSGTGFIRALGRYDI